MSENLTGIRKDYMQQAGFRMLLDEAMSYYPAAQSFNPSDKRTEEVQVNEWKAKSSEKAGFDLCFKLLTGITPEEFSK